MAREALSLSQKKMKCSFDQKAVERNFVPGEKVLVIIPIPGSALTARFSGPYMIKSKVGETDYIIILLNGEEKNRLCHVNMLKPYLCRAEVKDVTVNDSGCDSVTELTERVSLLSHALPTEDLDDGFNVPMEVLNGGCLKNSEVLLTFPSQLSYLFKEQQQDITKLVGNFPSSFNDVPPGTSVIAHDINVGSASQVKQHAYRCPLSKRERQ